MRFRNGEWNYYKFNGSKWQTQRIEENKLYLKNAYRVLLTRARQGMVIFVPKGDENDVTRLPIFYDELYQYLRDLGIENL